VNAIPAHLTTLCAAMLLLAGCTFLPSLKPLQEQSGAAVCPAISPAASFTAVHRVVLSHAAMGQSVGLGVVQADGRTGALHAVLMTLEGLVVCEAEIDGGQTHVLRALPPLDKPGFAEGLMADVAFLFLAPAGTPTEVGADEENNPACRWQSADGPLSETLLLPQGVVRKRLYGRDGTVLKEAMALPPFTHGLPAETRLQVFAPVRYTIEMTLLDREQVD
jgi:hypothetical protein